MSYWCDDRHLALEQIILDAQQAEGAIMPDPQLRKSRGHKITYNSANASAPYRLIWKVARRGANIGYDVEHHRDTDREGAQDFATRWGIKMPRVPGQSQ